jgi:hypothetical protein
LSINTDSEHRVLRNLFFFQTPNTTKETLHDAEKCCCALQTCDPLVLLRCKLGFALGQVLILPASAHQPLRERVCDVSETYWRPIQMEEK